MDGLLRFRIRQQPSTSATIPRCRIAAKFVGNLAATRNCNGGDEGDSHAGKSGRRHSLLSRLELKNRTTFFRARRPLREPQLSESPPTRTR